ncbi:MAG: class I SAM-dependent DNA methyltransferase [Planctomycetes bacterium]|nr:class I SAM-dependent DNA methyltransferase [Planctomycetota bacterium]
MTPQEFIHKWQRASLSERSACQQHFLDLCDLLGQPKPAEADPDGAWYTFERGVSKTAGGKGWADVWMRGCFGWEYKGKHKDLRAAYSQLLQYRESLENPPLLVVCDLDRFEIHTNFTRTAKRVHAFDLDGLADPQNLDTLRKAFTDPDALRPGITTESVTQQAAERFGQLADQLRLRKIEAERAAHFLMKLMFCMFAEDIHLLPTKLFSKVLEGSKNDPARLAARLKSLFEAMTSGGDFGADEILHFNGGLFADADVIELRRDEIEELIRISGHDWEDVEPSVFGTLFERTLDPAKRSQIGAHYTSRDDILTLLEPVVMTPLRREWEEVKAKCEKLISQAAKAKTAQTKRRNLNQRDKALRNFVEHLAHIRILDPACGSGNFLYVAINLLLDLEKEVIAYAATRGLGLLPQVRPTQLYGIEINPYAQQLAQVVIWIGYLQWMHHNGFNPPRNPVLEPIETIRRMDAILDLSDPDNPQEPDWPAADFIVGNPPFLGNKKLRAELSDEYVEQVFLMYESRIPNGSDLCCYWFERAREQIVKKNCGRAGLLATQGIRGGRNREVLIQIKETGSIFFAESDRPWILDGANVHVSMVGFDNGQETSRLLDGKTVASINSDLSSAADFTAIARQPSNIGIAYIGTTKKAPLDISDHKAMEFLHSVNPHGKPNSDVVFPFANGLSVTRRDSNLWIIDFGERSENESALYEKPFEFVKATVLPLRRDSREKRQREKWWLLARSCPEMVDAIARMNRFIVTPTVCKHRVFLWFVSPTEPDHQLYVFARNDDHFFGILQSKAHELWALRAGTRLETRPRYTPTTCFETFPFPEPTEGQRVAIGEAAAELDRLRSQWLNPPEWTRTEVLEFPGSSDGPWARYIDPATVVSGATAGPHTGRFAVANLSSSAEESTGGQATRGTQNTTIGTVRYPRIVPKDDECAKELKKRTLTNLYNERPTWLDLAHKKLDQAVFASYGWPADLGDEQILERLLELNLARASTT